MSRVSQARNLGKYFLLIDNMLVVLGFFVVFPLISIRFVDQMGWAAVMVGIALGLRQFIQQGLGIFGGAIADRFGAKPMIDAAFSAGGQINSSGATGPLLLSVDDAGQRGCGDWRAAGKLVATIRFSPGLRDGRYFVHIMRPFQRMAASGLEAINGQNAGA